MLAYCFRVMSSKYSPIYLQSRIDNFIDGLSALLVCLYVLLLPNMSALVCYYIVFYLTGSVC